MSTKPYSISVITKAALAGAPTLAGLPNELPAASSWGRNELFAFRVVVEAANSRVLPHLTPKELSIDALIDSNSDLAGLTKPTPSNLRISVEMDLSTRFGHSLGQFWAALGDVVADDPEETDAQGDSAQDRVGEDEASSSTTTSTTSSQGQPPPKRIRRKAEVPDMVDATHARFGSSSPRQASSQVDTDDDAFVPSGHDLDRARETQTERLVTCFVRHILHSAPYQQLQLEHRLECRGRLSVAAVTVGGMQIRAEDDGGLRLRVLIPEGQDAYYPSRVSDCYHLLFETKRRFHHYEGRPHVSDAWLGQMTAEALVARLKRRRVHSDPFVIIIAAARQYVRFFQFCITDQYLLDVGMADPKLTLPVAGTVWLDLGDPMDRKSAVKNILGLMYRLGQASHPR
ncbi:hypothetical protein GGR57DRAFT_372947 [Xylariaceae sp. FL1272]|nr:hypothetical protein GGR57DRAFT_372947 [Xylariaceae sp. FL1272]